MGVQRQARAKAAALARQPARGGAGRRPLAQAGHAAGICGGKDFGMTVHLWVRAEQRPHEERVGVTPEGVAALIAAGIRVSVEESSVRAIPIDGYRAAGAEIVAGNSWPDAPRDAIIFGLKELP